MTREEQIDWLCRLRADLNNGVIFTPWNKEFTEALTGILEQEQKTGHWIKYGIQRCEEQHYKCTSCGYYINFGQWGELYTKEFKYCPNCGAKMVEPQESEG